MLLAEVVGAVWGSVQARGLDGYRLLACRPLTARPDPLDPDHAGAPGDGLIVAADRLGAGPGERVLLATGSRVRDLVLEASAPFKSLVVAIVDHAELGAPAPASPKEGSPR